MTKVQPQKKLYCQVYDKHQTDLEHRNITVILIMFVKRFLNFTKRDEADLQSQGNLYLV